MAQNPQLSQSLSPSSTTVANTQPPRLRQACDGCTAAKVKCDKGRPACQRCLDGEELCQYSPSRRHGKRVKRTQVRSREGIPSPLTNVPPNVTSQMMGTTAATDLLAWNVLDPTPTSAGFGSAFSPGQELDLSNLLLWNNFGSPDYTPQSDTHSMLSTNMSPIDQSLSEMDDKVGTDSIGRHTNDHTTHGTEHALECEARALTVLRSLQCSPALCTQDRKRSQSISAYCDSLVPKLQLAYSVDSMDALLATNKAALSELMQLLECRCAESSHVALLHLTILSKIVFWYNVAVTARFNSERVDLKPMKIQLGMLDLDDDDRNTLHRTVLCRELQKAGNAVRAFEVRFASSSMPVCDKEPPWGRLIIRAIREDLERSINEIERGQSKPF